MAHIRKSTILVTGVGGRIGSALVARLLEAGFAVLGCDRAKPTFRAALAKSGHFTFVRCDLARAGAIERIIEKHDINTLVHLAAVLPQKATSAELFRHNVLATFYVVSAAANTGIKKLLFASSMTVYGMPQYLPVDEKHPLAPLDFYGATKAMGEWLVEYFCASAGIQYVSLRFPGIFTPERREGALYAFASRALAGDDIKITATKPVPWDILLLDDAVHALERCVFSNVRRSGVFNVGYGTKVSFDLVAAKIKKLTRSSSRIVNAARITHPAFYFDTTLIRKTFGITLPPLRERLKEYIAAVNQTP